MSERTLSDVFDSLSMPFEEHEIKHRRVRGGTEVPYADARAVMRRLDEVVGPENWSDAYTVIDVAAAVVHCRLTVMGVTKEDAGYPNKGDADEPIKEAFSDALRRAAVKFGVARYLYGGGSPAPLTNTNGAPKPEPIVIAAHKFGGWTGATLPNGKPVARLGGVECLVRFKDDAKTQQLYESIDHCALHNRPYYSQVTETGQLQTWTCNGTKIAPCRLS